MNAKELQAIRNRCESATGGKWTVYIEGRDVECDSSFIQTSGNDLEIIGATVADYDFIAHARQDIISLLDEIERLRNKEA